MQLEELLGLSKGIRPLLQGHGLCLGFVCWTYIPCESECSKAFSLLSQGLDPII